MERAPGTHWIGGWVGPRAVLDPVVKRKIPSLCRESNTRTPIVQPVAQRVVVVVVIIIIIIIIIIVFSKTFSSIQIMYSTYHVYFMDTYNFY
jgi:hypothetical protein